MNYYFEALKKWNQTENPGKWCVPRKGSDHYNRIMEMKALMEKQAQAKKKN
jgi:hypothetical protein